MAAVEVQKRQVIKPTGENAGWLNARKSVQDKGGLPSNVLHDDVLVKLWPTLSEPEKAKLRGYYAAWAREVLVYPAKEGQFKKGKDVVDAHKDEQGREWVFPASSMPEEAVGRDKVGLFVDPQNVEVNSKRVVVLAEPKSIVVLTPFIQSNGGMGLVDEKTRVPLEVAPEVAERLTEDQRRWLYRVDGAGVRPLVRDVTGRRYVYALYGRRDCAFGVAYVGLEEAAPKIAVAKAPEDQGLLVKGVSLEQFRTLVGDANVSLSELGQTVRPEKLEAMRRLVQALEIKE